MTHSEIIQNNQQTILELYLVQNLKKSQIAHRIIENLKLDFNYTQVESFRRALSQFLFDFDSRQAQQLTDGMSEEDKKVVYSGETITTYNPSTSIRPTKARILFLDIETSYAVGYFFPPLYNITVNHDHVIRDSHMICWAAQWLYEPEVFGDVLTPEEMLAADTERITKSLWKVMDEADIIVAHNGKDFDIRIINTHFLKHDLPLPSQYELIDTILVAKKTFRFASNKLEYINTFLGLPKKIETPKGLWVECMKGDAEALGKMFTYCKNDTNIMIYTYLKLRRYIKGHPNMGFYSDTDQGLVCPVCGGTELMELEKPYHTLLNQFTAYRCPTCGALGHARKNSTPLEKKEVLIAPDNR